MPQLKSIYVSAFITASLVGLLLALIHLSEAGWNSPWLGAAIACGAPIAFVARVYTFPIVRASDNMHIMLGAGIAGTQPATGESHRCQVAGMVNRRQERAGFAESEATWPRSRAKH